MRQYRELDLGEPPADRVLDELRERCKRKERHLHGEHEVPIEVKPDLRLDLANYKTRCDACHNAKTARELAAAGVKP